MTDLVINVLTEENANKLKEKIFGNNVEIVYGNYSGCYGLKVNFAKWFSRTVPSSFIIPIRKFLYGEPVIGIKSEDLCYYEFLTNHKDFEEVEFRELFPDGGFYRFDKENVIQLGSFNYKIYYKGNPICCVDSDVTLMKWVMKNKESLPIISSGLSKIYRRGFIDSVIRAKWKLRLGNILVY